MSAPFLNKLRSKPAIGTILLIGAIALFPLINYYFGGFYFSTREDFKGWYPNLHFIIYPVVKILPFAFLLLIIWLLHEAVWTFIKRLFTKLDQAATAIGAEGKSGAAKWGGAVKQVFPKAKLFAMNMLLLLISTTFVLVASEFVLRKSGMKPGFKFTSPYFNPVDSLINYKGFTADSNGIFCISAETRDYIRTTLQTKNAPEELEPLDKVQSTEVYALPKDFLELRKPDYQSAFKTFLQQIEINTDSTDTEFFQAIKDYVASPINSNGFKSIEFKKYPSKRKSILLLGDSFTWGHSSSNKTNGFADVLLTKGYIVYNSGITGIDPAQYLLTAKILVPLLQPDYVVMNFYMGNDIIFFERKPEPYVPVFYCTNAGNLISCPEGIYFRNAEEAYEHTYSIFTIPTANNSFNKFCAKTVIGTIFWRAAAKMRLADATIPQYIEYYKRVQALTTKTPYSDEQIKQTKQVTEQYGGNFLLMVIPSLDKGNNFHMPADKQPLFTGIEYHVPPVKLEHYDIREDGHYNDLGHQMHADQIDSLISGYGKFR